MGSSFSNIQVYNSSKLFDDYCGNVLNVIRDYYKGNGYKEVHSAELYDNKVLIKKSLHGNWISIYDEQLEFDFGNKVKKLMALLSKKISTTALLIELFDSDKLSIKLFSGGKLRDKVFTKNRGYQVNIANSEFWINVQNKDYKYEEFLESTTKKFVFAEELLLPFSKLINLEIDRINAGFEEINADADPNRQCLFFAKENKYVAQTTLFPDFRILAFFEQSNTFGVSCECIHTVRCTILNIGLLHKGIGILISEIDSSYCEPLTCKIINAYSKINLEINFQYSLGENGEHYFYVINDEISFCTGTIALPKNKKEMIRQIESSLHSNFTLEITLQCKAKWKGGFIITLAPNLSFSEHGNSYQIEGEIK